MAPVSNPFLALVASVQRRAEPGGVNASSHDLAGGRAQSPARRLAVACIARCLPEVQKKPCGATVLFDIDQADSAEATLAWNDVVIAAGAIFESTDDDFSEPSRALEVAPIARRTLGREQRSARLRPAGPFRSRRS